MKTSDDSQPLSGLSKSAYPDQPRVAVGAVVFKQDRVLLVQRARPPGQGQWAIPGGKVCLGETLQQAAEREILEETGIIIAAHEPVLIFDVVDRDGDGRIRYHYVIIDLAADYVGGELRAGDDALAARWVSSDELQTLPVNPLTRKLLHRQYRFGDG
jgi:8-oxo-dGTP diphosphatase